MASVACLHSSMQEGRILEHIYLNAKCHAMTPMVRLLVIIVTYHTPQMRVISDTKYNHSCIHLAKMAQQKVERSMH